MKRIHQIDQIDQTILTNQTPEVDGQDITNVQAKTKIYEKRGNQWYLYHRDINQGKATDLKGASDYNALDLLATKHLKTVDSVAINSNSSDEATLNQITTRQLSHHKKNYILIQGKPSREQLLQVNVGLKIYAYQDNQWHLYNRNVNQGKGALVRNQDEKLNDYYNQVGNKKIISTGSNSGIYDELDGLNSKIEDANSNRVTGLHAGGGAVKKPSNTEPSNMEAVWSLGMSIYHSVLGNDTDNPQENVNSGDDQDGLLGGSDESSFSTTSEDKPNSEKDEESEQDPLLEVSEASESEGRLKRNKKYCYYALIPCLLLTVMGTIVGLNVIPTVVNNGTDTNGTEPDSPVPEPDAPTPEPESPVPEPVTPAPEPTPTPITPLPEPESPVPEPDAPTPEPDSPAPEPDAPTPEPDSPAPEPDAPTPEPESPVPEPEAPVPDPTPEPEPEPEKCIVGEEIVSTHDVVATGFNTDCLEGETGPMKGSVECELNGKPGTCDFTGPDGTKVSTNKIETTGYHEPAQLNEMLGKESSFQPNFREGPPFVDVKACVEKPSGEKDCAVVKKVGTGLKRNLPVESQAKEKRNLPSKPQASKTTQAATPTWSESAWKLASRSANQAVRGFATSFVTGMVTRRATRYLVENQGWSKENARYAVKVAMKMVTVGNVLYSLYSLPTSAVKFGTKLAFAGVREGVTAYGGGWANTINPGLQLAESAVDKVPVSAGDVVNAVVAIAVSLGSSYFGDKAADYGDKAEAVVESAVSNYVGSFFGSADKASNTDVENPAQVTVVSSAAG